MMSAQQPRIGFVGLSHLGMVTSIATASKGFEVVGYDPDGARVSMLAKGTLPLFEPGLDDLFASVRERMTFTDAAHDLASCDVVYLSRDVPTDERNMSELAPVRALIDSVVEHMRDDAVLVVLCQVSPGFTRRLGESLRAKQRSVRLYYQVETLIFGAALERATKPERFIVGLENPAEPLASPYRMLLESFGCPILPMRFESAELAKISINMYLVSQVATTNTIAEVCERCGADWAEIAPALRLDRRIGSYAYLKPGLGIAGGNLERDLVTLKTLSNIFGTESSVIDAWWRNLDYRREWALRTLHRHVLARIKTPIIAVWGLAYKQDTDSIKNSPALALLTALRNYEVRIYDPKARLDQWKEAAASRRLTQVPSAAAALEGADSLVIMTPWSEFAEWRPEAIRKALRGDVIIDPYRLLPPSDLLSVHTLGVVPSLREIE